jgi:hypothetical protein
MLLFRPGDACVLQLDPGRPTSLTRKLNKGPYCRIDAVQKDGSSQACAVEYSVAVRGDLARDAHVLFLDFDQDAQNRTGTWELYQPFCINDGSDPRLERDPVPPKQLDDAGASRSDRFSEA